MSRQYTPEEQAFLDRIEWYPELTPPERRAVRIAKAREKGTHTKAEWKALHDIFGACVGCGVPYTELHGDAATKDHIDPILVGGCDCIANLQPLCRQCNSSSVPGDLRFVALPGWQTIYLHRMGSYF